jgi:hypothetical protein
MMEDAGINAYLSGCLTLTLERLEVPRTNDIYSVDCAKDGIPLTHSTKETDYHKRREIVMDLLKKYSSAKKVYTTRLHCYLVCRAFGTEVEYLGKINPRTKDFIGITDKEIKQYKEKLEQRLRRIWWTSRNG